MNVLAFVWRLSFSESSFTLYSNYCSKECQRAHWKATHKALCARTALDRQEANKLIGADVLRSLSRWNLCQHETYLKGWWCAQGIRPGGAQLGLPPRLLFVGVEFQPKETQTNRKFKATLISSYTVEELESAPWSDLAPKWREADAQARSSGKAGASFVLVCCQPVQGINIKLAAVPVIFPAEWEDNLLPQASYWKEAMMGELNDPLP